MAFHQQGVGDGELEGESLSEVKWRLLCKRMTN
jgi:hypothetical protein